ncbi:MAG TPA: tetratricopeptide repeat-containing diguanylate cyclase [Pyrinomonadaceae bacterium]
MHNSIPEANNRTLLTAAQQLQIADLIKQAEALGEKDINNALTIVDEALRVVDGGTGYEPLDEIVAECFHLQGRLLLNNSEYRSGLVSFSKAQAIYDALNNKKGAAVELLFIGIAQAYVGLYADALKNMFEAQAVFESTNSPEMMNKVLNAIGYTYVLMNEFDKALAPLQRSAEIARVSGPKIDLANTLDSLSAAHLGLGNLEEALKSSLESIEVCRSEAALIKEAEYLLGLGSIYCPQGDLKRAEKCFADSLSLARKYGYRFAEAGALRRMGQLEYLKKDFTKAISLLENSLRISTEIGASHKSYECLSDLSAVCKDAGDFELALNYFQRYHAAKEAIFSEQAEFRVKSLEVTYKLKEATREKELYYLKNVALQNEVEERMKAQALAEHLAITDALTGLFNRRQLLELAEREVTLANRYHRTLSLIIFDLDHFKRVNDTFGHVAGDRVLVAISHFVQRTVRKCDIIGRYGGEEFALLLPETSEDKARAMFERIRGSIEEMKIELDEGTTSVTISAGIAEVDHRSRRDTLEQLLDRADKALYAAKAAGRNQVKVYSIKS